MPHVLNYCFGKYRLDFLHFLMLLRLRPILIFSENAKFYFIFLNFHRCLPNFIMPNETCIRFNPIKMDFGTILSQKRKVIFLFSTGNRIS